MTDNPSGQLYASLGHAWQPSLSSDGRYLLVNGTGGGRDQLYRYNSDGNNGVRVSCEGTTITSEFPTFSPDGSQYAFDGRQVDAARPQIYYHSLAEDCDLGDNRLSINGGDAVEQNGFHPVWGTDNWLYFRSCATWPGGTNGNCGVWGKQMNGDGFRQVSNNPNHLPTDAKGQWVLLTFNNGGVWDVYRVSTQGGNALNLSKSQSIDIWGTISPDGQTVAFISNRSGYWAIWLMDIDGSNPREWQSIKQLEWGGIPTDEIPGGRMSWSR
jgi:TolB protein